MQHCGDVLLSGGDDRLSFEPPGEQRPALVRVAPTRQSEMKMPLNLVSSEAA